MKKSISFPLIASFLICHFLFAQQPPKAPTKPVTETFFGKQVIYPYRNLENLNDSTVMNWYKAQAAYTEEQLKKLPLRETLFVEMKELMANLNTQ